MNVTGMPERHSLRRVSLCFVGFLVATLMLAAVGSAVPTVFIEPAVSYVQPGETFDVQVMINADADTISNFQVIVQFDPEVLEFREAYEGSLYAYSGLNTWFFFEEESLGTWEVFDVIFPALSFILPPGELTRLEFLALDEGSSPIEFLSVSVKDILRYPILPLESEDGLVYVGPPGTGIGPAEYGSQPPVLGRPHPNPSSGPVRLSASHAPGSTGQGLPVAPAVQIYDVTGHLVRQLDLPAFAETVVEWDGRDARGRAVPAGVYFLQLDSPAGVETLRVVISR